MANRRNFLNWVVHAGAFGEVMRTARASTLVPQELDRMLTAEVRRTRIVPFSMIGGVGDGDIETGAGTDNARPFAIAQHLGELGFSIKFEPNGKYKTTAQLEVHNMHWIGDSNHSPIIFGWFTSKGKKILGRSRSDSPITATIDGLTFFRCGPNAEHAIVVDNMQYFYFNGTIDSVVGAQGGAIGISPFYPERRPSVDCHVFARLRNSGDFGVQFGAVKGGVIEVQARDCYREVIGIEPVILNSLTITKTEGDCFFVPAHGLNDGDPLLYYENGNQPIFKARGHVFAIRLDQDRFAVAASESHASAGRPIPLGSCVGEHLIIRSAVVEDINIKDAEIVDVGSVKPSLYGNTTGYVIFTGNSGGYMKNITVGKLKIRSEKSASPLHPTIGVYLEGAQNIKIDEADIVGCDRGILMRDGHVNGVFSTNGKKIAFAAGNLVSYSYNNIINNPRITDFSDFGIAINRATLGRNSAVNIPDSLKSKLRGYLIN